MSTTKYIDPEEFVSEGYLQEINRRFLHPLGMALAVSTDMETGKTSFVGVIDDRDDMEGVAFHAADLNPAHVENFDAISKERRTPRVAALGYWIQPLIK